MTLECMRKPKKKLQKEVSNGSYAEASILLEALNFKSLRNVQIKKHEKLKLFDENSR